MPWEPADDTLLAFRRIVGEAHFLVSEHDRAPFEKDWRGRYHGCAFGVARPKTTEEVAALVSLCKANNIPVVVQGGNTGLCGAATPDDTGRSLIISLGRMQRVRNIDPLNNAITVEAGCVLAAVQEAAEMADRLFPMALGSEGSCQVGGNLSTNAGGTAVLRYGTMRDLVLGLEVVLPDGRIWDGLRALRKDNTGYDLKHLFIGAEGTLGVITAAVLKLFPRPRASSSAMVSLPSVENALTLLTAMRAACGDRVNAFEIMSDTQMQLVLKHIPDLRNPIGTQAPWFLMIELTETLGDSDLVRVLEDVLGAALEAGTILDAVIATSQSQADMIWRLRHSVSESNKREGPSISHDTSVPVSRLPDFIRNCSRQLEVEFPGVSVAVVGHVGDGNVHVVVFPPSVLLSSQEQFESLAKRVNAVVHDASATLGGSISAEHGIGQSHAARLPIYKQDVELDLMRAIKRTLDPDGLFNPGKVLLTI